MTDDGPTKGDTMICQTEFGPPKFNAAIPEKARRAINATKEEYLTVINLGTEIPRFPTIFGRIREPRNEPNWDGSYSLTVPEPKTISATVQVGVVRRFWACYTYICVLRSCINSSHLGCKS